MAKKAFGFQLGRMRLGTVPFAASQRQELDLAGGIPRDYMVWAFLLRLRFRLAISGGTTNGTIVAEAGQNLLERVEISGNHKVFGDWTRLNLQGSHLYQLGNIYDKFTHTRSGVPASGAIANSDIEVAVMVHMVPPDIRPEEQLLYLLDPPMWNNLQLYVDWGAAASLVSGGDRTLALSAYGSGTGNPECVVTRFIARLGDDRLRLAPIPIKQTYKGIDAVNNIADGSITELNTGNFLRHITLVTGVKATGASAATRGDNFLTLTDAALTRAKVKKDDIPIRDIEWVPNQQWEGARKHLPFAYPSGYNMFEFVEDGTVATSFDTREIALSKLRFELTGDVTGAANQRLHVIHYEMAGVPLFKD